MVNWDSPEVINVCQQVADKLSFYFSGIYTWHYLTTLRYVEFPLLIGKLKWRWSYITYLAARYLLLGTQIPLRQVQTPIAFEVLAITGCLITVFTTGNLLLRPIAIWNNYRTARGVLVLLGIGQWVLVAGVAIPQIVKSAGNFVPNANVPKSISSDSTVPFLMYSFILDLIIVVMTVYGLNLQQVARSSPLWKSLYINGIIYYVVTSAVNLPTLLFVWITHSACVLGAFSVPGLVISVMASSQAVISLLELPEMAHTTTPGVHERTNIDVSALISGRLSTNINLSLRTASNSDVISSIPHGSQDDLERNVERHGPNFRQVSFMLDDEK